MSNEEYENPYEEHWEDIMEFCDTCCYDLIDGCVSDEMCPGCDCSSICEALEGGFWDHDEYEDYDEDNDYEEDEWSE
jgi:hypothetical protein